MKNQIGSATVERKTVSDFYWLKNPPTLLVSPGARSTVSRLKGSRGPGRQLAGMGPTVPSCWLQLSLFLKRWGSSSEVTPSLVHLHGHVWWADASRPKDHWNTQSPTTTKARGHNRQGSKLALRLFWAFSAPYGALAIQALLEYWPSR